MNTLRMILFAGLFWVFAGCQSLGSGPAPSSALTETYWVLSGVPGSDADLSGKAYLHLTEEKEKRAEGFAGCNRFSGKFDAEGGAVRIGPLATTRMMCPKMGEENAFLDALRSVDGYRIEADTLLLLQDGTIRLLFRASKSRP